MRILTVASELAPFAKTGGLADVLAALPPALRRGGHVVRTIIPLYDKIDTSKLTLTTAADGLELKLGGHSYGAKLMELVTDDPAQRGTYFLHCPALYARGSIYTQDPDEHRRFLALSLGAILSAQRLGFAPDVVHCHDWQAAFIPLVLKTRFGWDRLFSGTKTLLTIHNLNYQGMFRAADLPDTNLADSRHLFHQEQLTAGVINSLLHGIMYADGISTVSPTYAREIQTAEHGAGLDPLLRARRSTVVGILNGVDYDVWSPDKDRLIPQRYDAANLSLKERNKQALLETLGLPYVPGVPVVGVVSRLAGQKGFSLLDGLLPELLRRHGFQLVVLGSGESRFEDMFARFKLQFPRQVAFYKGFQDQLAHLIEAGADMFLMPSRYEPCGLNQMYSLRYGTVPIVHRTGGLADTVRNGVNGFSFEHHDQTGLRWAMEAALGAFKDKAAWRRLILNGMAQDFSWDEQRKLYEVVYTRLGA